MVEMTHVRVRVCVWVCVCNVRVQCACGAMCVWRNVRVAHVHPSERSRAFYLVLMAAAQPAAQPSSRRLPKYSDVQ